MPRKSLPACEQTESVSFPHRKDTSHSSPDPLAASPELARSSRKRGRRAAHEEDPATGQSEIKSEEGEALGQGDEKEFTLEQQLEAWQEFAAEHYEIVEQLPLELHRNFRLLRELDDGCMGESVNRW
jgi:hypothetical protein